MEQIAESLRLPFPCKYSTNGCDVTSLLTEKAKHEDLCEHKPYKCPEVFGECQWSGSREEVTQHLRDKHKYPIKDSGFINCQIKSDDDKVKQIVNNCLQIFTYKKQNFLYINKFDSNPKEHFKAIALFIGEQRIADQFKYKIEIRNKSNGTRLEWEDKPISIRRDVKSLLTFEENYGLNIDQNMFNRLWDINNFKIILSFHEQ